MEAGRLSVVALVWYVWHLFLSALLLDIHQHLGEFPGDGDFSVKLPDLTGERFVFASPVCLVSFESSPL